MKALGWAQHPHKKKKRLELNTARRGQTRKRGFMESSVMLPFCQNSSPPNCKKLMINK